MTHKKCTVCDNVDEAGAIECSGCGCTYGRSPHPVDPPPSHDPAGDGPATDAGDVAGTVPGLSVRDWREAIVHVSEEIDALSDHLAKREAAHPDRERLYYMARVFLVVVRQRVKDLEELTATDATLRSMLSLLGVPLAFADAVDGLAVRG